jgi:hypothetical protein
LIKENKFLVDGPSRAGNTFLAAALEMSLPARLVVSDKFTHSEESIRQKLAQNKELICVYPVRSPAETVASNVVLTIVRKGADKSEDSIKKHIEDFVVGLRNSLYKALDLDRLYIAPFEIFSETPYELFKDLCEKLQTKETPNFINKEEVFSYVAENKHGAPLTKPNPKPMDEINRAALNLPRHIYNGEGAHHPLREIVDAIIYSQQNSENFQITNMLYETLKNRFYLERQKL